YVYDIFITQSKTGFVFIGQTPLYLYIHYLILANGCHYSHSYIAVTSYPLDEQNQALYRRSEALTNTVNLALSVLDLPPGQSNTSELPSSSIQIQYERTTSST